MNHLIISAIIIAVMIEFTYGWSVTLYDNYNHRGSSWIYSGGESNCKNLDVGSRGYSGHADKASSINTHGYCVVLWTRSNCEGGYASISPKTGAHNNFRVIKDNRGKSIDDNIQAISGCERLHKCEERAVYRYDESTHRIFFTEEDKEVVSNEHDCGDATSCSITLTRSVTKTDSYTITETHGWNVGGNIKFFEALSVPLGYSGSRSWATTGSTARTSSVSYSCGDSRGKILRVVFIPEIQLSTGIMHKTYPSECIDLGYKKNEQTDVRVNSFSKFKDTNELYGRYTCEAVARSSQPTSSCKPLWDGSCVRNSDCCTNHCWRERSDWIWGVCKP